MATEALIKGFVTGFLAAISGYFAALNRADMTSFSFAFWGWIAFCLFLKTIYYWMKHEYAIRKCRELQSKHGEG